MLQNQNQVNNYHSFGNLSTIGGYANETNSSVNIQLTYTGNFGNDKRGSHGFNFGNNGGKNGGQTGKL